jgi:hypothetical protein
VEVVRCADVDDVDALGADELLRRVVGAFDAQARRRLLRALGRGGRDADDLGPGQARRARVDGADEAGRAGDGDAQAGARRVAPEAGAQDGTPSSAFLASTSIPCSRARFSPRILRFA